MLKGHLVLLALTELFGQNCLKALVGAGVFDSGQLFLKVDPIFHVHHMTCCSAFETSHKVLVGYCM